MTKVEQHAKVCKELNELYSRKNSDYGDSFGKSYEEFGPVMAAIRISKANCITVKRLFNPCQNCK